MHGYLKAFDQIQAYGFDVFVGGHLTAIGNREDVLITRAYVMDLNETVKRVHGTTDMMAVNTRWAARLAGLDVWPHSHASTTLNYIRWDD